MSGENTNFEYDIFLCHNKADKPWVHELAETLENEQYDGRTLRVFFDEWDIKPGENIVLRLNEAIGKSHYVGVVLSREMLKAEWPAMEWTMAVNSDPSGRKGFVVPIWRGGCEIPPALKIRNVLYFRDDKDFKKSYPKLIALLKGQPMPRGAKTEHHHEILGIPSQIQPPFEFAEELNEQLAGNIFPVTSLPTTIWSAPARAETNDDVYGYLKRKVNGIYPTFLLRNNRLYSFWDLNDKNCPFRPLLSGDVIEESNVSDWIGSPEKVNGLIEMLNRAFRSYSHSLYLRFDKEHHRFFFPPYYGENREITWHTGERKATRTVVKKYKMGKTEKEFWAHQAFSARFLMLGEEMFLELNPGWTFTVDGVLPIPSEEIGSLSTRWMHDEYNPSVFYHIRFWSFVLAKGTSIINIPLGNSELHVDVTPATADISVGIGDDILSIEKVFEVAEKEIPPPDIFIEEDEGDPK